MRKFLITLVAFSLLFVPIQSFAKEEALSLDAKAAILVDASSGKVLFQKDADKPLPIASITKVMTLNLIFDAVESGKLTLNEKITVSETAAGMGGSQAFIDAGYDYSAEDLIKSIIIASANDSAVAMAERLCGSEETFVSKMNQKAKELGMDNTNFENCTGLPEANHLSTASDVAKMSIELLKHKGYFKYSTIWMDELKHEKDGRSTELVNTNRLIRSLQGCDGLKTGSTSEAKFCVTTTAKRGDMRLISVVLGGSTSKLRFEDASKLINYGFANFENKVVVQANQVLDKEIPVKKGKDKSAQICAKEGFSVCVENSGDEKLETRLELAEFVEAPAKRGLGVGKMTVLLNGEEIGQIELVLAKDCEKASFFDRLKTIIAFWK
ncbi:MAG: D-alanyl-D-alanine carboxypeptidase [Clostridia bacterium]|nr:D-alanyl-D-alanine carboxypeptidase [Clostridia bacterium]